MSVRDPGRLPYDGFTTLEGGVDSYSPIDLLAPNQVAWAQNVSLRGFYASTRPGFERLDPSYSTFAVQDAFQSGNYQGAGGYESFQGDSFLVASVAGRLFRFNIRSGLIDEITPSDGRNSQNKKHAYFCQAEQYLLVQDKQSRCIIHDGATTRRAGFDEIPVGGPMTYGLGRIWVARGREFLAGDLIGTDTGILKFTENDYLAGGGAFVVPLQSGDITGMQFASQIDTSTGQGSLLTATPNAVYTVDVPIDRETWAQTSYPTQRISQINYGPLSDRFLVPVNGDIHFRAKDGLRSMILGQRDFQTKWANTPLSREMNYLLAQDKAFLLEFASGCLFDNRLLFTVTPQLTDRSCYHMGLISLQLDTLNTMSRMAAPIFESVWAGIRIYQVLVVNDRGQDRCFAFVRGQNDELEIWELTRNAWTDSQRTPIQCVVQSKALIFQRPKELKRLVGCEIWADEMSGEVQFTAQYRPDQSGQWYDWVSWVKDEPQPDCSAATCAAGTACTFQMGYEARMILPRPTAVNCSSGRPSNLGYDFQVRLEWLGKARIRGLRVVAHEEQEEVFQPNVCPVATVESAPPPSTELPPEPPTEEGIGTEEGDVITTEDGQVIIPEP